jgi:hypothetical protein
MLEKHRNIDIPDYIATISDRTAYHSRGENSFIKYTPRLEADITASFAALKGCSSKDARAASHTLLSLFDRRDNNMKSKLLVRPRKRVGQRQFFADAKSLINPHVMEDVNGILLHIFKNRSGFKEGIFAPENDLDVQKDAL